MIVKQFVKISLLVLSLLLGLSTSAQNNCPRKAAALLEQNSSYGQFWNYGDWQLSNAGCWGCPSFYWAVESVLQKNGEYRFDIWFSSNSYTVYETLASTRIDGLYVEVNGRRTSVNPTWLFFQGEEYSNQLTSFTIAQERPTIRLVWEKVTMF